MMSHTIQRLLYELILERSSAKAFLLTDIHVSIKQVIFDEKNKNNGR